MGEVKEIMTKQNEHMTKTDEIFTAVKNGIDSSIDGVTRIAEKTRQMDEARINVVDVVQSLTAIAEENAATTEQTNTSMNEFNDATASLARTAMKLKKLSIAVADNLNYFSIEE